jgi:hypothetical protein
LVVLWIVLKWMFILWCPETSENTLCFWNVFPIIRKKQAEGGHWAGPNRVLPRWPCEPPSSLALCLLEALYHDCRSMVAYYTSTHKGTVCVCKHQSVSGERLTNRIVNKKRCKKNLSRSCHREETIQTSSRPAPNPGPHSGQCSSHLTQWVRRKTLSLPSCLLGSSWDSCSKRQTNRKANRSRVTRISAVWWKKLRDEQLQRDGLELGLKRSTIFSQSRAGKDPYGQSRQAKVGVIIQIEISVIYSSFSDRRGKRGSEPGTSGSCL